MKSILVIVAFVVGTLSPWRGIASPVDTNQQRFDPDGFFYILGEPPGEFRYIGHIALYRGSRNFHPFPSGVVSSKGNVLYKFNTLTVTRHRFAFTTRAVRGVSYSFTGRFLKGGVFATEGEAPTDIPYLEGRLRKLRGGKRVAEAYLKFTYFAGT